jgi:hypothetical protein
MMNSKLLLTLFVGITAVWYFIISPLFVENFAGPDSQGDLVLRNLYRQIHNLEALSRNEVSQNNDYAGGSQGISKERLVMEDIARRISRLKTAARYEIANRRMTVPVKRQDLPPLGYDFTDCHDGDCQLKMDYNERILGIPSAPGNRHGYHYNNRPYQTSRVPAEQIQAEDMHMV